MIINLQTGYEVEQVFLHYGAPFVNGILGSENRWEGKREEIIYKKNLKHGLWWTTTVQPEFKRCRYFFGLITVEGEIYYYFEDKLCTKEELDKLHHELGCFVFPWMNEVDINQTPKWVNDTI